MGSLDAVSTKLSDLAEVHSMRFKEGNGFLAIDLRGREGRQL